MFSQDEDENQRTGLMIVFALVGLVVASVVGWAAYKSLNRAAPKAAMAVATAPAPAPAPAAMVSADGSRIVVEQGVVKFFFASGKTALADGAPQALADTVKAVAAGKKAVISGYADATGDAKKNAELSKQRAFAVRDALAQLGVPADKIELRKPAAITANAAGASDDARRVDVVLE
jgi:outer membrane protein OmpA-like peptidoglycan-associated protein